MDGFGMLYPVYIDIARTDIPPTEFAKGSDVKPAAILRNHAFIVTDMIKMKSKKILSSRFSKASIKNVAYLQEVILNERLIRINKSRQDKDEYVPRCAGVRP
jgi:hypothetical protein